MRRKKQEGRGQKGNPINKLCSVLNETKYLGFKPIRQREVCGKGFLSQNFSGQRTKNVFYSS
jgi:hypothetical protein